jgi:CDP-diacylglycerol---glycerol-3-phosphate 3-phosphatidyltransferase
MIGEWVRARTAGCFSWVARALMSTGISANMITALGFILSGMVGYWVATDHHILAAGVLIFAGLLDGLDGSLARASGRQTRFGAFWDSTLDRLSESLVFLGLLIYFVGQGVVGGVVLVYISMVGSLLVSYVRARAEGLGISCHGGFMTRFERVVLVIVGLVSGRLVLALGLLAVLSVFTAFQRMYLVWLACDESPARAPVPAYGPKGERS